MQTEKQHYLYLVLFLLSWLFLSEILQWCTEVDIIFNGFLRNINTMAETLTYIVFQCTLAL